LAATATATVNSDGVISALNIVSGGSGYVIAPMVTIPAPTVPTVVARTTGSITFESGARLSLNITPASASYTLLTADGGITGTPVLETSIPGYELTKSSDGKNLLLEVVKTTPTITVNPTAAAIVYGQTLASAGLSDGSASVRGTFAFTSPSTAPEVGTSSQSVTFTPTDTTQYNTVQLNVSVTVSKANPATVFPTAATITYGQALSAVSLTGGTGAGTYAFTSPATIPNAGLTQNFEMTFTPSVPANYNTVTQMVSVSVNKATPTVSVAPTASAVTVGDQLSTSNLSGGTASVAGTYAWTTPGTVVDSSRSYPVTFNPADGANYNTASTSASVTANPAGTTYSGWLSGNGGAASDTAFLNYVFGAVTAGTLDPSLKPTVAVSGSNLVLTYNVRQGTVGLTVTAQTSADLATGAAGWGTSGITDVAVGTPRTVNGVSVQQRTASISVSGGKKFLRVKAEQAP
jgi:hypothetical protein